VLSKKMRWTPLGHICRAFTNSSYNLL
jgi:hypothetical protein